MKHEWRKHEKDLYFPSKTPHQIIVPAFDFFTLNGTGNPNSELFAESIGVLYSVSYAIRMSYKWDKPPANYYDYTVYPLEGIWDIADKDLYEKEGFSKDNLAFEIMIRQPSFVTTEFASTIIKNTKIKKPHELLDSLNFKTIKDGNSVQMLHLGSYDDEPQSFAHMNAFITENNLTKVTLKHREIYLNDARKTAPDKLKTVLRYFVS